MQIIFVRHGEPDFFACQQRGWIGLGRDYCPLTEKGLAQAEEAARDPILAGCEFLAASPYPRALHTAAILSRVTGIPIRMELDIHEWVPDLTMQLASAAEFEPLYNDFYACEGLWPAGESRRWEPIDQIAARSKAVFDRLLAEGHKKIAAVCHNEVIKRYVGRPVAHCERCAVEYTADFVPFGWVG